MIKRVFKTIFILSLCLGITLPANAGSVVVSDGSAFITKSELSYELNNLSNRMTQLENSLDSRIDKLVSSYLTRNGIWNGAKQNLANNQCYAYYDLSAKSGRLMSWYVTASSVINQTDSVSSTGQYRQPGTKYVTNRTALTGDLNKSGLLYCKFNTLPYLYQSMVVIPFSTSDTGQYMQSMNGKYTDWMQITDQDDVLKYREDTKIGFLLGGRYYLPTFINKVVFFFVSKGDQLFFQTDANMNFSILSTDDSTPRFGHKWEFLEVSIY